MEKYAGKSVFRGIAIGRISIYEKNQQQVKRVRVTDTEAEKERYAKASEMALSDLSDLYEKAVKEVGEANAGIFGFHQTMIQDDDFIDSINSIIETQQVNAEYAIAMTADNFAQMFSAMNDDYMSGRVADVKDVGERLISILSGKKNASVSGDESVIVVAEDLAPSETVQMDKDMVISFVTTQGSVNSHTAILSRTMGIPSLIDTDFIITKELDGKLGIVDGNSGVFIVDPDDITIEKYKTLLNEELEKKQLLLSLKGKETVTVDGKKIRLYANIGNSKDLAQVLANDAAGIGLFRSEFVYLEKDRFPTEEEQLAVYKAVLETMAGKPVIIRTLDIGADKQCDYFEMEHEENPAMGCRAIRICLSRPEIFKTQLRALYRASAYGNLAIMYPMITSVGEINKIREMETEVKRELKSQGIEIGNPATGIMIETPAAVMISDELAKLVDFFSIGTNDLTQYTLAIDRQNSKLDTFYDSHHPAVLKMIKLVVDNAHEAGIWAGICGELAGDTSLTHEFIAMGVDELSVSSGLVLPVRKQILDSRACN